jgi:serine protease Do
MSVAKAGIVHLALIAASLIASPAPAEDRAVESLRQTGKAFASVARKVSPAVAFIQVEARWPASMRPALPSPFGEEWPFGDEFFRRFFGDPFGDSPPGQPGQAPGERPALGQGSGFVFAYRDRPLSDKTYILTNSHVVSGSGSRSRTDASSTPPSPGATRGQMWPSSRSRPVVCQRCGWRIPPRSKSASG